MAAVGSFTIDDLERISTTLRTIGAGARDMQEAAQRVTDHLYDELRGAERAHDCVAVTLHKTHDRASLPPWLRARIVEVDAAASEDTACLVRMAVSGSTPLDGVGSIIQPLTSRVLEDRSVLGSMLAAMELDVETILDPTRARTNGIQHRRLGSFLIGDVASSTATDPATRDRLRSAGVRSVFSVGAGLPSGNVLFVSIFARSPMSQRSAELMRPLATAVKATLIPLIREPFSEDEVS